MKKGFVALATTKSNELDWRLTEAQVYTAQGWKGLTPKIYINGEWKTVCGAGTNMIYFLTNNGDYFLTSNGEYFLVRQG